MKKILNERFSSLLDMHQNTIENLLNRNIEIKILECTLNKNFRDDRVFFSNSLVQANKKIIDLIVDNKL